MKWRCVYMKRTRTFFMVVALVVSLSVVAAHAEVFTHPASTYDRGMELMEAQDYAGALALFDEAIAENGDVAEFHLNRGLALIQLFRYEEAERAYAKAVEIEPENARYLDEYGMAMVYTEQYQDAYEAIDKAVTLEPFNGEYFGDRGFVLYLLNRHDEALDNLERAIELAPDYDNAYYFAAIVQYELGGFEEAIRYCEEYLARVPIADEVRLMLGDAQFELGRFTEALAAYDQAIANGGFTAEDIANYAAAEGQAEKPPALQTYSLNEETIPSIDSIVGYRTILNTEAGFSISQGGPFVKVYYLSGSVLADLQAYVNALIDTGWAATMLEGDDSGGTIQLAVESVRDGKLLVIICEYSADAYSILSQGTDGTLRRYTDDAGNKMGEILSVGASDTPAVYPAEPDDIIGVWYLTAVVIEGNTLNPDMLGMQVTMALAEDNTVVLQMTGEEDATGTWAITDGLVVVSANETDRIFTLADGKLSAEQDGMRMVLGREKAGGEALIIAPIRTEATLSDFNGIWNAFYADYQGAQLPIEIFGIEVALTIENGVVNATLPEENIRLTGDVLAGVLTATGAGEEEGSDGVSMSLNLHEDGILSCAFDESLTLFFQQTGE